MSLKKKRWLILTASCLINLCIGSLYAWSVFAAPMAERLSTLLGLSGGGALTAGDLAMVFTVANAVGPVTLISGGAINDRLGPKWVIFAGGVLFGAGMILSGLARSVAMLTLGYGLLCGLAMGLAYGCTVSNAVKFFPDRRGLIGGIAVASYGLSSVLIPPVANAIIGAAGVDKAFLILGGAFLAIICPCSFLVEKCPDHYVPEGWTPPPAIGGGARDKDWRGMLADPIFYVMLFMLCCGAFFGLMTISQASPVARQMVGMSTASATAAVSVLALFNAAGRVVCGYVSDRLGRMNTLTGIFLLSACGLGALYFTSEGAVAQFYLGMGIVGFCFGSFMGIFPGFTADVFGVKNNSVNYGIMFIGFALAGIFGPMLMSQIYLTSGSYQPAFLTALLLVAAGLLLSLLYRALVKQRDKT